MSRTPWRELASAGNAAPRRGALSRRSFIKLAGAAGGGLVLACALGRRARGATPALSGTTAADGFAPNPFIHVAADGTVTLWAKNPKLGQGVETSLPMILAEELEADWRTVRVVPAPLDQVRFGVQGAGGSWAIASNYLPLRRCGAAARMMLLAAAAQVWEVPVAECHAEQGTVRHGRTGRRLGFGELASRAAQLPVPRDDEIVLKPRNAFRLLGTRVGGLDNRAIVVGQPLFAADLKLPGMRYAVFQRCPAAGGTVRVANLDRLRESPGVVDAFTVPGTGRPAELSSGVAILAESTWTAFRALRRLRVEWDLARAATDDWGAIVRQADEAAKSPGAIVREAGNVSSAFAGAARIVESFYSYPFLAHAAMETLTCAAWFRDGRLELWATSQLPENGAKLVSRVLGLPREKITVHPLRAGGSFGRRLFNDWMVEAAAIALRTDGPIQLVWTREQDTAQDFYRPAGFHALRGALDAAGRLVGWQDHFITFTHDGKGPADAAEMVPAELPFDLVPHFQLTQTLLPLGIPTGWWRAPSAHGPAWAIQSFLHELSAAAGRDHVEFLLELLGAPRWLQPDDLDRMHTGRAAAVIRLAAEKSGWGQPLPPRRARGLAFHFSFSGHFAEVVELSAEASGRLRIHRVTVAGDVGPIVNRSGAEQQVQGAVLNGLNAMATQQITFSRGEISQKNFDDVRLLQFRETPPVDVHFIESDFAPTGLGEPPLPPLAPAVGNAIFAATGRRVRSLPLSQEGFEFA